ncbi:MAG: NAD+ synthase [Gammaproteobacteria bacterium]|nr:NAD+ synthase [Gammaproteobacteria bacterium]
MSNSSLKIAISQLNFLVGDVEGNCEKIITSIRDAKSRLNVDCIIFSELALTGYPPEDLLYRSNVLRRVEMAISKIEEETAGITVILGSPWTEDDTQYNAAIVIQDNHVLAKYYKIALPNYDVFDEKRYFVSGASACVVDIKGVLLGLTICEDIWSAEPARLTAEAGAQVVININASPYHVGKQVQRESEVAKRVQENDLPVIYVNQVGGQDELVFDGGSFAMDRHQNIVIRAFECEQNLSLVEFDKNVEDLVMHRPVRPLRSDHETVYKVLVYGLQEYVNKNGFNGGLIGLSGGIDSALVLALAVDALGAEKVHAVMMPSKYTSEMSLEDARELAQNFGVKYSVVEIDSLVNAFEGSLGSLFDGVKKDTTEENIQARIRGVLLMALSNKFGQMVISTGNKSEMAVGYATLYGDMAGGYAPLKDVPKTLVYELANYRNKLANVIPNRIIDRPPSAELAPNQKDEDSLPPYDELDEILKMFIEQDKSRNEIVSQGFDEETVSRVIKMVFQNEYKRRQAPPGIKITKRAFGKDRRYPITSGVLRYLNND